jgi:glycosyltransferase involved in cell wall biosynthesis
MLWSILICAIPERFHSAQPLLYSLLETQAAARRPDIEFLYLMDNRRRTVGAKRNALLDMAVGEYVSFIDDDDLVAPIYIDKLYRAIVKARKQEPPIDVICFQQKATLVQQGVVHRCTYSLAHYHQREPDKRRVLASTQEANTLDWTGPPAHTMVWRREVVRPCRFPEKQFGEDVDWVDQACERAKTELTLTDELYFYNFNDRTTATR